MGRKFVPLSIKNIDEGTFVETIDEALLEIQKKLIGHTRKYGQELAKGAKASLNVKLTLKFEGRDRSDFSVRGEIKETLPGKPANITVAIADEEQDGTPLLFVAPTGSRRDDPRQGILITKEGDVVDTKTGEVKGSK